MGTRLPPRRFWFSTVGNPEISGFLIKSRSYMKMPVKGVKRAYNGRNPVPGRYTSVGG